MSEKKSSSLRWVVIGFLLLLVVGGVVGRKTVRALWVLTSYKMAPNAPKPSDQTLLIPGLKDTVKVHYDKLGVPHIEAKNREDLYRAVGYVHGAHRFFQMDMLRRVASGRLSEIVGKQPLLASTTVAFDRAMKGWEFAERTVENWSKLTPAQKKLYKAYCVGVNTAVKRFKPIEYKLLGLEPEPWTPKDMLVVGLLNSWTITHNWQQELVRFLMALKVGVPRTGKLYPHKDLGGASVLKKDEKRVLPPAVAPGLENYLKQWSSKNKLATRSIQQVPWKLASSLALWSGASNAWAVSGKRSKTGHALMANDPHMSHFLPSVMFQMHLKAPGLDVIGVGFPGLPVVLMGHNQHVSWGLTAAVADAIDLVVEKPDPKKPGTVLHEGKECKLTSRKVQVKVRKGSGFKVISFTLRRTCNGPILNDILPDILGPGTPLLAIRWRPKRLEQTLDILDQVNRAKDVPELKKTIGKIPGLVVSCTAADTKGNIAVFWAGNVPKREHHLGTFPIPGWKAKYEWKGFIPASELPGTVNPTRGWVAHANNLMQDPVFSKHTFHVDSAPPYRVHRIGALLKGTAKHDLKSFIQIQRDVKVMRALPLVPILLKSLKSLSTPTALEKQAIAALKSWDFQSNAASVGTSVFFKTYAEVMKLAARDEFGKRGFRFFLSQRYSTNVVDLWWKDAANPVWDNSTTSAKETRTQVLQQGFRRAVEQLKTKFGGDIKKWRWGILHRLDVKHLFGRRAGLKFFNLPLSEGFGTPATVWKSHFNLGNAKAPFRTVAGPVFRMVVNTGDIAHSFWSVDTGVSGWPGSKHFGDQFKLWKKGKLAPMVYKWSEVLADKQGTWVLKAK